MKAHLGVGKKTRLSKIKYWFVIMRFEILATKCRASLKQLSWTTFKAWD